jgi:hypothetical protein
MINRRRERSEHTMTEAAPEQVEGVRFPPSMLAIQVVWAAAVGAGFALVARQAHHTDFAMLWAAEQTPHPYDPTAISAIVGVGGCWFPYAPPFLLLIAPFRIMSLGAAFVVWASVSAAAITASLRRPAAPVVLLSPAVFLAAGVGQTSLLMAAMLYLGARMPKRPLAAGVMFGLAAVIKPQVIILLPIVLLAARQWRTIVAASVTASSLSLVATLAFGWHIWADWLASLPAYVAANDAAFSHRYLSLPGPLKFVPAAAGALACGWAARARKLEQAVFIAIAAALLSSLHSMDYDAAILAPFAVAAALDTGWRGAPFFIGAFLPASRYAVAALALMACAMNLSILKAGPGAPTSRWPPLRPNCLAWPFGGRR